MHVDFIERDHYCDYSVCFVNEQLNRDTETYEYNGYKKQFNVWFMVLLIYFSININVRYDERRDRNYFFIKQPLN